MLQATANAVVHDPAHAYLQSTSFASYTIHAPPIPTTPTPPDDDASSLERLERESRAPPAAASFEISLPALMECLNIFGNAAPVAVENAWVSKRRRMRENDDGEERGEDMDRQRAKKIGGGNDNSKVTAARFSYAGVGYPLLIL